jgi:hypothetical protein
MGVRCARAGARAAGQAHHHAGRCAADDLRQREHRRELSGPVAAADLLLRAPRVRAHVPRRLTHARRARFRAAGQPGGPQQPGGARQRIDLLQPAELVQAVSVRSRLRGRAAGVGAVARPARHRSPAAAGAADNGRAGARPLAPVSRRRSAGVAFPAARSTGRRLPPHLRRRADRVHG